MFGLRILAAEAQDGGAGDVGVVNVAGQQPAESLRILARAAAAALMGEEADAIDVGEDALGARLRRHLRRASLSPLACRLTSLRTWLR